MCFFRAATAEFLDFYAIATGIREARGGDRIENKQTQQDALLGDRSTSNDSVGWTFLCDHDDGRTRMSILLTNTNEFGYKAADQTVRDAMQRIVMAALAVYIRGSSLVLINHKPL